MEERERESELMIQKSNLITIEAVFSIAILAPNFMATECWHFIANFNIAIKFG